MKQREAGTRRREALKSSRRCAHGAAAKHTPQGPRLQLIVGGQYKSNSSRPCALSERVLLHTNSGFVKIVSREAQAARVMDKLSRCATAVLESGVTHFGEHQNQVPESFHADISRRSSNARPALTCITSERGGKSGMIDRRERVKEHLQLASQLLCEEGEEGRLLGWLLEDCVEVLRRELDLDEESLKETEIQRTDVEQAEV